MSSFRISPIFRQLSRAPRSSSLNTQHISRPLFQSRLYAQQSYGGGGGDPKGEAPQEQGHNPSEHLEHPGPPSPADKGKGKGEAPPESQPKPEPKSEPKSTSKSSGAQPKIHSGDAATHEHSEETKAHNEDMKKRHDRAHEGSKNEEDENHRVDKGFWSGMFIQVWIALRPS